MCDTRGTQAVDRQARDAPSPAEGNADAAEDEAEEEPPAEARGVVLVGADEAAGLHAEVAQEHRGEAAENALGVVGFAVVQAARAEDAL